MARPLLFSIAMSPLLTISCGNKIYRKITLPDELIVQASSRRRYNENHQFGHEISRRGGRRQGVRSGSLIGHGRRVSQRLALPIVRRAVGRRWCGGRRNEARAAR
jgi:hypothetical protein